MSTSPQRRCYVDKKVYDKLDTLRKRIQKVYPADENKGKILRSQIGYFSTKNVGEKYEVVDDFELCQNKFAFVPGNGCPAMPYVSKELVAKAITKLAKRGRVTRGMLKIAPLTLTQYGRGHYEVGSLASEVETYHGVSNEVKLARAKAPILLISSHPKSDKMIYPSMGEELHEEPLVILPEEK
jgi:hypothetical protein